VRKATGKNEREAKEDEKRDRRRDRMKSLNPKIKDRGELTRQNMNHPFLDLECKGKKGHDNESI